MTIPIEIFWPTLIGAISYIVVAIVKLKVAMRDRVTYTICHENREGCPCKKDLENIKKFIDKHHPRGDRT